MSNKNNSRNIPLPIKREVRQRCGFGCVICGFPLYEYDHMKEWSKVQEHKAEDITLLCDKHHKEVTTGLLPRERVFEANKNPYNLREGCSSPLSLHFNGESCEVDIGGNIFTADIKSKTFEMLPLIIDGVPLVGFVLEKNQLFLNVNVFDKFNNLVLQINNNELVYSTSPWDIELVGQTLTIREKARKFLIRITFEPPNKISIKKGRFLFNGVEVLINEDHMLITNNNMLLQENYTENVQGGLIIGSTPKPIGGFMHVQKVNRYLGDSKESLKWAKKMKQEFSD